MKIGLLSDTHGFLPDSVFKYFELCDEIWHAGDIGTTEVADKLNDFKPFFAVYGNIDGKELRSRYPEDLWLEREQLSAFITHIGGYPPNYNKRVKKIFANKIPDIFICGHSHILKIMSDKKMNNLLYINPGAAGKQGFHKVKTLIRFDILNGKVSNLQVIELGKRG